MSTNLTQEQLSRMSYVPAVEDLHEKNTWRPDPSYKGSPIVILDSDIASAERIRAHIEYESGLYGTTTRRSWVYKPKTSKKPLIKLEDTRAVGL